MERLLDPLREAQEAQLGPERVAQLVARDELADPRAVDDLDPREVEEDLLPPLGQELVHDLAQDLVPDTANEPSGQVGDDDVTLLSNLDVHGAVILAALRVRCGPFPDLGGPGGREQRPPASAPPGEAQGWRSTGGTGGDDRRGRRSPRGAARRRKDPARPARGEPFEGRGERFGPRLHVARARVRVLGESGPEGLVHLRRHPGKEGRDEGGRVSHDVDEDPVEVGLHRHPPAHEGLVADGGERVDVGPHVHLPARDLLRRHPGGGPDDEAALGQLPVAVDPLGEAEVEEPDAEAVALRAEEDVLGLDVAVDDPGPVSRAERRGPLPQEGGDLRRRPAAGEPDEVGEVAAVKPLHDEEHRAVTEIARVEEVDDVRVPDGGDGVRLLDESPPHRGVLEVLRLDDLHRHDPVELLVVRLEDGPHPPFAEDPRRAGIGRGRGAGGFAAPRGASRRPRTAARSVRSSGRRPGRRRGSRARASSPGRREDFCRAAASCSFIR